MADRSLDAGGGPTTRQLSPCRGCGQTVLWAETKSGKRQPFDPEPKKGVVMRWRRTGPPIATVVDIYTAHHATCPQRAMFRK